MTRQNVIRLLLLLCAAAFLAVGILRDEPQDVLNQATTICTECVGLQPGYNAPAATPVPTPQPVVRLPLGVGQ